MTIRSNLENIARMADRIQIKLEGEHHPLSGDVAVMGDLARSALKLCQEFMYEI